MVYRREFVRAPKAEDTFKTYFEIAKELVRYVSSDGASTKPKSCHFNFIFLCTLYSTLQQSVREVEEGTDAQQDRDAEGDGRGYLGIPGSGRLLQSLRPLPTPPNHAGVLDLLLTGRQGEVINLIMSQTTKKLFD